ncbi:cytochrome P450 4C1-like [Arctopsyche grandis]|uniref:cytochrome P450 4C1-like n=1 Tax=Arctopsyche grandis TaxID=121162 RepID=UPI00406DA0C5
MEDTIYVILSIITIIAGYAIHIHIKNKRFWKLIYEFRGDDLYPIIGNAQWFTGNSVEILETITKMWERNGRSTYRIIVGNAVFTGISDPEIVELLLGSNKEIEKMDDYKFLSAWLGDGLLLSKGNKWRRQRKIITPTFHFKILEQFVNVFNDKGKIFIEKLAENKGKVFDVYPYVTLCALDIISESAMGTNMNAQNNSESEYVKAIYRISEIVHLRTYSTWKRNDWLYMLSQDYRDEQKCLKVLHETTNQVIQSRKLTLRAQAADESSKEKVNEDAFSGRKKVAFLDLLLLSKTAEGEPLSDEVIREEVDTFMFEGHDTTSSGLSFALFLLANNPAEQELAFEEQLALFGGDFKRQATYRDLQDMKYLDRVIKETQRIYPSVPFYGRKLKEDLPMPDGKIMPAGTFVTVQPYLTSRNPKYYPNPMKFDPDRFLPDNVQKNHPYLYVPFSAGPRNCIGQKFAVLEMKSTLSRVLRNFELSSAGPDFKPQLAAELILKSKNGLKMRLNDRKYPK